MGSQSIRTKIALWTGLCLLLTSSVNLTLSVFSAREEAMRDAQQIATASAVENMLRIRTVLERAMFTAKGFAQSVTAAKDHDQRITFSRRHINLMLRRMILENPDFVGGATCWEPNAFDGRDAEYANTPGHDDSGRISYYWFQDGAGNVSMDILTELDSKSWYVDPVRKKHETLSEPYVYPIHGKDIFMTTVSVPIQDNRQVYGVATIDVTLDFLQHLVDDANVFDGAGRMAIISNKGVLVAASGTGELAGKPLQGQLGYSQPLLNSVAQGESYYDWNEQGMEIGVPLIVGQNDRPWGIYIQIPADRVMASVNALMWNELGGGVVSISIALLLLWVIATRITKSIRMGTEMAESIGRGDLSPRLRLNREDEVGKLAEALNRMAESLSFRASQAENLAAGELQQRLALASELDVFSQSLQTMTENFNNVIGHVDCSSKQIILASEQIAEISRGMILGASRQATLIEEVSRTVSGLASQLQSEEVPSREVSDLLADRLLQVREVLDQIGRIAHENVAQAGDCASTNKELADHASSLDHELQRFTFLEQINAKTPTDCR